MKLDKTLVNRDEDAVSPVIGVILMVAITVILAAVIGTFVLGLGSNVQENPQMSMSISQGQDADGGVAVNVTLSRLSRGDQLYAKPNGFDLTGTSTLWSDLDNSEVGSTETICGRSSCTVQNQSNMGQGNKITFVAQYEGTNSTVNEYTIK